MQIKLAVVFLTVYLSFLSSSSLFPLVIEVGFTCEYQRALHFLHQLWYHHYALALQRSCVVSLRATNSVTCCQRGGCVSGCSMFWNVHFKCDYRWQRFKSLCCENRWHATSPFQYEKVVIVCTSQSFFADSINVALQALSFLLWTEVRFGQTLNIKDRFSWLCLPWVWSRCSVCIDSKLCIQFWCYY